VELDSCVRCCFTPHYDNDHLIFHVQGPVQTLKLDPDDKFWPVLSNAILHGVVEEEGSSIRTKTYCQKLSKNQYFNTKITRKPNDNRKLNDGTCVTIIGPLIDYNPKTKEFTVQMETQDYCPSTQDKKRKTLVSTSVKKIAPIKK
jgi:hypothetical protein